MDTLTPTQRHNVMSHIRSHDTKPEIEIRSALFRMGFRFRKNDRRYPGTPDIVLPHYHAVVFVNGCFWHGHTGCKAYRLPKTNTDYWQNKIEGNIIRDAKVTQDLIREGWRICIVWECSITGRRRSSKINDVASEICRWLEEHPEEVLMEV